VIEELSLAFDPDPSHLAAVRDFARHAAESLGATVDLELLAVVVGELAANAVVHQHSRAEITVRRLDGGILEVAVRDGGVELPRLVNDDPASTSGHRGIQMVAALSDAWGVEPSPVGKRVWARLPTTVGST